MGAESQQTWRSTHPHFLSSTGSHFEYFATAKEGKLIVTTLLQTKQLTHGYHYSQFTLQRCYVGGESKSLAMFRGLVRLNLQEARTRPHDMLDYE